MAGNLHRQCLLHGRWSSSFDLLDPASLVPHTVSSTGIGLPPATTGILLPWNRHRPFLCCKICCAHMLPTSPTTGNLLLTGFLPRLQFNPLVLSLKGRSLPFLNDIIELFSEWEGPS
ncbi:hypothetical protein Taro_024193 [Colocasia esculenta]|uniref:Uncharacterized protein n=1 Tax=Colocasia esculenta TaxID=4460 RepID=A0A843V668_COLES|nr:hypothetical protein [Colocasia esculenta]